MTYLYLQDPELWDHLGGVRTPESEDYLEASEPLSSAESSENNLNDIIGSSNDTFLTALTHPHPDNPRLSWISADSSNWKDGAHPITDIKEEGSSLNTSGSSGNPEATPADPSPAEGIGEPGVQDEPAEDLLTPTADANANLLPPPEENGNDPEAEGHLNQSFSASHDDLVNNLPTDQSGADLDEHAPSHQDLSPASSSSGSNPSISHDSNSSNEQDTFQNDSTPVPIPKDIETSTPLAYIEPQVIVVENGGQDSDDTLEDIFHGNKNISLDTTPVLAPMTESSPLSQTQENNDNDIDNNNDVEPLGHSTSDEECSASSSGDRSPGENNTDEGYGTGKFLPEGDAPLLPPGGTSPGIVPSLGRQKMKAKKKSNSKVKV